VSPERLRTVVTGVGGRMGSALVRLASTSDALRLVGGTARSAAGQDLGTAARIASLGIPTHSSLRQLLDERGADVVIDFTGPEASLEHARICAEKKVAMVIGTTGFTERAKAELADHAKQIPMVVAPNTSVGVNVVFEVARHLARLLESFDVEIVETHHRLKKDAPSGTALKLAEEIAAATGRDASHFAYSRHGQIGARPPREIGLQTVRGGDVVGEHTVFFFGEGERVELTHRATNRDQFARGALRAAEWVARRAPGLYDMKAVLGLEGSA
jgi:4-hydroxy-tetrahydrodipicolinate reductase